MFKLHGVYAPIPTPFKEGKIAYDLLEKNLEFWLNSNLEGIVVMGSNGEFVYLSSDEKVELTRFVCEKSQGKKPVIAGTGAESTEESIRLCQAAAKAGAAAALVVTPNYYKGSMTDAALHKFYTDVADASPIPVILYNMPRNTGINISAKLVAELSKHPNIIGMKDSGGNIVQIQECIAKTQQDFDVFAGSASYLYASLAVGATGGTLALANIFPNQCAKVQELYEAGKFAEALELQNQLVESNNAVTAKYGIAGLKAAMDMLGLFGGEPRLPMLPLGEVERAELQRILTNTGFLKAV